MAKKMNELASGYNQERVMEKLNGQLESIEESWANLKPTINKFKSDPEMIAYAE